MAAGAPSVLGKNDRWFYMGMSIASIIIVFVGFAPTYYLKDHFGAPPLTPLVHLHGLVFTCWILLFFAQTVLIASHRIGAHRRLGVAGAALAGLLVMVDSATALGFARRNIATGGAGILAFLANLFGDMLVFGFWRPLGFSTGATRKHTSG